MPAVDSPDPGGLSAAELTGLLAALAPRAVGAQVTVFDPDLDPDGSHARLLTDIWSPASPRSAATAGKSRPRRVCSPQAPGRGEWRLPRRAAA